MICISSDINEININSFSLNKCSQENEFPFISVYGGKGEFQVQRGF